MLVALCLALSACEEAPQPEVPTPVKIGGALAAHIEILAQGGDLFAAGLSNYGLLYGDDAGLFIQAPGTPDALPLGADLGQPRGMAELSDASLLLLGSAGLFAVQSGILTPSPLQSSLAPLGIDHLLASEGEQGDNIWLFAADTTHLWSEGLLYRVEPAGLRLPADHFSWGAPVSGKDALWVASQGGLYSIRFDDGLVAAQLHRASTLITAMAVDGHESLWLAADGDLFRRWPDDRWEWFSAPFVPSKMTSIEGSGDLWLETETSIWHHSAGVFQPVEDTEGAELVGVDGAGRAIARSGASLIRISAGRPLLFLGLSDGSELELPTEIQLLPTFPEGITSISVSLDGDDVTLAADLSLTLDPLELSDGAHELAVLLTYEDSEEVDGTLYFSVGEFIAPSWQADIYPIFSLHCSLCHLGGQQATTAGGGHPINSAAIWQLEIEMIIEQVEIENMPLNNPPLSAAKIQTIKAWRAGGFLE
jgi:hypothetical protein